MHESMNRWVMGMLRKISASLLMGCLLLAFCIPCVFAEPAEQVRKAPQVSAQSAVLINADTGSVLYEKNAREKLPMASTTKIMTAWLTLEAAAAQDKVVTVTEEMVRVEGSSMGLMPGYKLHLSDLAVGMLLASGNDAANTAAIAIDGSIEAFAARMNERASEIGMQDTHFVTPSGLDAEEHYSTAYDMALLGAAAMQDEAFSQIACQRQLAVDFVYPEITAYYTNHNKLLRLYEDCIGVKTGFTKKSGRCLVSAAERDGVSLVAVTLNAPDDWNDHQALYDYGFSLFSSYTLDGGETQYKADVVGGMADSVLLTAGKQEVFLTKEEYAALECTVEQIPFLYAPVKAGDKAGCIRYELNGKTVAELPLTAKQAVTKQAPQEKNFWQKVGALFSDLFQGT